MDTNIFYIAIALAALAIIALLFVFINRNNKSQKKLSRLAGLAFSLVIAGIVFGEDRLIGYGLIGSGVLLAVIDMIMKLRDKSAKY